MTNRLEAYLAATEPKPRGSRVIDKRRRYAATIADLEPTPKPKPANPSPAASTAADSSTDADPAPPVLRLTSRDRRATRRQARHHNRRKAPL